MYKLIYTELSILPYDKLLTFSKLLFMHSIHDNYCPVYFSNTWQLNNDRFPNLIYETKTTPL